MHMSTSWTTVAMSAALAVAVRPAWWLLAAGGTVLAIVDAQRNLLPTNLVYPLAVIEAAVLVVASITTHDAAALSGASLAALVVGTGWFLPAFAADGVGLGDVRVATLTAGLLGWLGWTTVMRAQLVTVVLIGVTAAVVAVARPDLRARKMPVRLGPSLVLASLLMCWM
jgi:leader peptidase (prepilin peptidase) / N-methyltransferase